jgi:hypothetical protein
VLALFVLPRAFWSGPIILIVGLIAGLAISAGGRRDSVVTGCLLSGGVLTVQGFVLPLLVLISAHVHTIPLLGYILHPVIRLFDPVAAFSGGSSFVYSYDYVHQFSVSLERLGFIPLGLLFVAVVVSWVFRRHHTKYLGKLVLLFIVYAIARYLLLLFSVVISGENFLYWNRAALFLSLVPFVLILARLVPFDLVELSAALAERTARDPGPRRVARTAILTTFAAFLLTGAAAFHDPGTLKQGRILFDEKYSDWEWTTQAYDREWYGRKSGYNYYCLAEYVDYFYDLDRGTRQFTPDYLAEYDIVIVKTPTEQFTQEEIDALEGFVHNGGGLFLIGDHTNVFGTSTNLNPVAQRFGMRFNYDSTYELTRQALSYYRPPALLAHPATVNLEEFLFATSCTMDSPLFGENVIAGNALRAAMLDYSQRSFFPSDKERRYDFGFFMQMAGAKVGNGRVLGFTDSTVWSNFFMFVPGKPELFLGALDWLNRTNRWSFLNSAFSIVGLLAAILAITSLRDLSRLGGGAGVLFGLVLGVVVSLALFDSMKLEAYPPVQPREEITTIAFDRDPSVHEMPVYGMVRNPRASIYTFYVWTQRLGLVPVLHSTLSEALENSKVAVVANPGRRLTVEELDDVASFCKDGGNLLLITDMRNRRSTANDLLGIFRMAVEPLGVAAGPDQHLPNGVTPGAPGNRSEAEAAARDAQRSEHAHLSAEEETPAATHFINLDGERVCRADSPGALAGGIPVLTLPEGAVAFAYQELGDGRFFAFTDFSVFSQAVMGPTGVVPSREQREVYELEFQILEILLGQRDPTNIEPYVEPESQSVVPDADPEHQPLN